MLSEPENLNMYTASFFSDFPYRFPYCFKASTKPCLLLAQIYAAWLFTICSMTELITKHFPTYSALVYRQCVPQPYLTVEAEQHDPLAAKSVWEAAEDNAAKHHTAEVDGGDEGRDVGPVTNKFPLKYRVYTYMQIQGWLSFIVHLECRGFTGLQGLFGLPKPKPKRLLCAPCCSHKKCWKSAGEM